ncbi:hypothetical protein CF65_00946 [Aggregatibacter actinomycetemcomitans HK1651]|nr:hypothetical protein CF65_00946 [Aggregatibacter actinomycetemcomitans HK1651]
MKSAIEKTYKFLTALLGYLILPSLLIIRLFSEFVHHIVHFCAISSKSTTVRTNSQMHINLTVLQQGKRFFLTIGN